MKAGEVKSINKASKCKTATRKGPKQGLKSVDFSRLFGVLSHSKTVGRGFKSYCPCQKRTKQSLRSFFIQSEGLVCNQRATRLACNPSLCDGMASRTNVYLSFGLMPYVTS